MRRPLFVVCLCLVVLAAMQPRADSSLSMQWDKELLVVAGRVCQKDADSFYLDSISLDASFQKQIAVNLQQEISNSDKLICEYENEMQVRLGSTVRVRGILRIHSSATNPGEFDSEKYYRSLQVIGRLEEVELLEKSESYSEWRELLFWLRAYWQKRLYQVFPEKEASVLSAMLLGDKAGLDSEVKALYQRNGIVHILSISGLHITLIGMSIYRLLRRMGIPVWLAAICGGSVLVLYGVMTGMSVSAVRAIGLFLLRMLAEVVGRTYDMLTALGMMAALMVWHNPENLNSAGFLLSYAAVLGIGVVYPAFLRKREEDRRLRYEAVSWKRAACQLCLLIIDGLKQSILASLSITLVTLPIQLWFYYEVPVYSVVLNLLVLPLMGLVMLTGLFAMLIPGMGILGTVTGMVLWWYESLCYCFERLPFHTWNPGKPEIWQIVVYYVLLTGVIAVKGWFVKHFLKKTSIGRVQFALLTIAVSLFAFRSPGRTTLTFLDVGQGDCICMETASGQVYLFDCGSSSRNRVGQYVLEPFLKYSGIKHIDAVFVSHADEDHCNGVRELLTSGKAWGITVERLVLSEAGLGEAGLGSTESGAGGYDLADVSVEFCYLHAGDSWQCGDISFTCLHPPKEGTSKETNADSQCFLIQLQGNFSILLTGDVEGVGEERLLEELQKRGITAVTLLKVPHHGSRNSTGEALLAQIQPKVSIISCGRDNSYGHPHKELLERLEAANSAVLTTAEYGAITIKCGKQLEIRSWVHSAE